MYNSYHKLILKTGWYSDVGGDRLSLYVPGYGSGDTPKLSILENGFTGIGTVVPQAKLDVVGSIKLSGNLYKGNDSKLVFMSNTTGLNSRSFIELWGNDANRAGELTLAGTYLSFRTGSSTSGYGSEKVRFNADGTVGIGTTNTLGYKLAVNGKIICEELRVKLAQNWPDYVFAEDYELMPLEEVEQSIKENGHLPGIPSAAAIEKEGGIEVGEMQRLMLEKIEEMTLHLIELKKENERLKKEMQELKNQ